MSLICGRVKRGSVNVLLTSVCVPPTRATVPLSPGRSIDTAAEPSIAPSVIS